MRRCGLLPAGHIYNIAVHCNMQDLLDLGYELVSSGGSAAAIGSAELAVRRVEELTGFPEMLDGELRRCTGCMLISGCTALPALRLDDGSLCAE